MSLFLDQHLRDGSDLQAFEPRLLSDIVLNFLAAGRDTTSAALTWFFYAMAQNPQVGRKLRQELAYKVPTLVNGELLAPSLKQLQDLPYLEAAVKESLRLYPTIPANIREANQDVVLCDGTFIRKGTTVNFPSYALGRMEWVWGPDARQFRPERWIDDATGKVISVSPYKFNVFLAGSRVCMGKGLAIAQIMMVAAGLLSRFHFEIVPGQDLAYSLQPTLKFKHGLRVRVVPLASQSKN